MSFDDLFRDYRRTAVLLHRRYPPHVGDRTNSKFGGLPNLPAHYDWPRTPDGTPLHFLAQIDCADIAFPTELPERGVLFFFGRDDDEQIWDEDDPAGTCRVLYALDAIAGTPPRDAPADLPPIGGMFPNRSWRDYLREGESGPNVHVEWPVQPLPIDSWPDSLPVDNELLEQHRQDAFAKATGERPDVDQNDLARDSKAAKAVFVHAENGADAYPQYWITVHYAARALLHQQLDSAAEEWLRRSNETGLDRPVSEEDRSAFRAWLIGMGGAWDESRLGSTATNLVLLSLIATIRAWAGDATRAARLPPHVYAALRFYFSGFTSWGVHFSQMLGYAPSAQSPQDPGDPTVCLLNLTTDHGLGWSFGDGGYCTFRIEPDDLAQREFSDVRGTIEGY